MKPVLLLIVVAVVIAVLLWYRRKTPTSTEALPPSNRFHAVTIYSPPNACPSARMLGSTKFLAKEAPRLPLDNCTAPQCQCRYEHYDDRRADERRDTTETTDYQGEQRRSRKDRRKEPSGREDHA